MNLQSVIAFVLAAFVLGALVLTTGDVRQFLDVHAILVVIGGTMAAGAISFQVDRIILMFRIFLRNVLGLKRVNYVALIEEMMRLGEAYRLNSPALKGMVDQCDDPFLQESMVMVQENALEPERIAKVLRERVNTIYERESEEVIQFRAIGKYPPAFGLIGTTLSMITLLGKLGDPEGQKVIGPAMAIGLVATFYGLVLSNLILIPISENLANGTRRKQIKNTLIVEGIILILERTNPIILAEELNSFLVPSERIDWHSRASDLGIRAA